MAKPVSLKVSEEERELIEKIALRADTDIFKRHKISQSRMDTEMDLCATIANGCPLRLEELLAADAFNFAHDICGIGRHINRQTGELENCFLPRFAKPSVTVDPITESDRAERRTPTVHIRMPGK